MSLTETDVDKNLAKVVLKKLRHLGGFVIGRIISEKKEMYIWCDANKTQIIFLAMHTNTSTSVRRVSNV